jgi:hypothetical protein
MDVFERAQVPKPYRVYRKESINLQSLLDPYLALVARNLQCILKE